MNALRNILRVARLLVQPAKERDPNVVTADELEARARRVAEALDVEVPEAFAMLDRGDLDGTLAEVELEMIRHLGGSLDVPPVAKRGDASDVISPPSPRQVSTVAH